MLTLWYTHVYLFIEFSLENSKTLLSHSSKTADKRTPLQYVILRICFKYWWVCVYKYTWLILGSMIDAQKTRMNQQYIAAMINKAESLTKNSKNWLSKISHFESVSTTKILLLKTHQITANYNLMGYNNKVLLKMNFLRCYFWNHWLKRKYL